jgi:hypothetical protein
MLVNDEGKQRSIYFLLDGALLIASTKNSALPSNLKIAVDGDACARAQSS